MPLDISHLVYLISFPVLIISLTLHGSFTVLDSKPPVFAYEAQSDLCVISFLKKCTLEEVIKERENWVVVSVTSKQSEFSYSHNPVATQFDTLGNRLDSTGCLLLKCASTSLPPFYRKFNRECAVPFQALEPFQLPVTHLCRK